MKCVSKAMLCIVLCCGLVMLPTKKSHAIIWTVIKAAAKKVIKALDLQVQRMQNKTIILQNAQKTIENTLSKLKLQEIAGWTEKQRQLYAGYFDELWKVKNAIATYKKIKEIVRQQVVLVDEYKRAYSLLREDTHFTPDEIDYMYRVYSGILSESIKNIDQLFLVINSFSTQMSDGKRLEVISAAANGISENMVALQRFTDYNIGISIQRAKGINEIEMIRQMYGITGK